MCADGLAPSVARVHALIAAQIADGLPPAQILIGGFSQVRGQLGGGTVGRAWGQLAGSGVGVLGQLGCRLGWLSLLEGGGGRGPGPAPSNRLPLKVHRWVSSCG